MWATDEGAVMNFWPHTVNHHTIRFFKEKSKKTRWFQDWLLYVAAEWKVVWMSNGSHYLCKRATVSFTISQGNIGEVASSINARSICSQGLLCFFSDATPKWRKQNKNICAHDFEDSNSFHGLPITPYVPMYMMYNIMYNMFWLEKTTELQDVNTQWPWKETYQKNACTHWEKEKNNLLLVSCLLWML